MDKTKMVRIGTASMTANLAEEVDCKVDSLPMLYFACKLMQIRGIKLIFTRLAKDQT